MAKLSTEKVWYIAVEDKKEGPFSALDLRNDFRVTPDTLVWKEGFTNWVLLRFIPELQTIFEDDEESEDLTEKSSKMIRPDFKKGIEDQTVVLTMGNNTKFYFWRGLLAIMVLLLLIYIILYVSR